MEVVSPRVIAGRYQLQRLLGRGGMAEVWLARDTSAGGEVAVKFAIPAAGDEAHAALEREAGIGRRLRHPNIVRLLDDGDDDGTRYLVFEYAPGPSLREVIDWRGPLPESTVLEVGTAVAAALQHAHARGVLHNDLKPGNVVLSPSGPKVLDFGAASSLSDTLGPARARELMGTIAYLAPEVLQGQQPTPRSDIYALGLTLFEAATGRLPFPGTNPAAVAGQRLLQPAPNLRQFAPEASPRLESVVGIALALDPAQRFATGEQFASALTTPFAESQPTVAIPREPATAAAAAPPRRRTPRWPLALAGAGLLAAGAGLALTLGGGGSDNASNDDARALVPIATPTETPTPEPTATPTPTQRATATPTATPTKRSSGNNGNSDKKDKKDKKNDKVPLPTIEVPSPGEIRDAFGQLWESWRDSVDPRGN